MDRKEITYNQYVEDVLSGRQIACEYIKLACKRFLELKEKYEFRPKEVEKVISFFSILKHVTDEHVGNPFYLEPWQQFIVANIYGLYREDGTRLIRSGYIDMARKNGKTAFGAGLSLYHLIADSVSNAEVYLAANSKEQAKTAFRMCSNFTKGVDPKSSLLSPYRDTINFDATYSFLKVLAADDTKLDGFNASMYLLDEYHAAKNNRLKNVLQSSQAMRSEPLGLIITTAGFDKTVPCYEYRQMCIDVLHSIKEDDSLFVAIFSLDKKDDWKDSSVWIKSNPNLGVTVKEDFIKGQIREAENSPSEEVGVKTKTLNVWVDSSEVWIPTQYLNKVIKRVDTKTWGDEEVYVGIDLSATSDLTCVCYMAIIDGYPQFKVDYYLPESALNEKRQKIQYGEWYRRGYLKLTPGNVTDYDVILNDICDFDKEHYISKVGYDSWNATQFVINATERGLPMEPYSQSLGNFNRPTKELERLVLSNKCLIDSNLINRHCFVNAVMIRDSHGNTKPSKKEQERKIDGLIAMIQALGVYLISPNAPATF